MQNGFTSISFITKKSFIIFCVNLKVVWIKKIGGSGWEAGDPCKLACGMDGSVKERMKIRPITK